MWLSAAALAVVVTIVGAVVTFLLRRLDRKTEEIKVNVDGNLSKALEKIDAQGIKVDELYERLASLPPPKETTS